MSRFLRIWMVLCVGLVLVLVGCGDDDADNGDGTSSTGDSADSGDAEGSGDSADSGDAEGSDGGGSDDSGGGAAAGGTLVLGDETIALDSARCFLEEQDAAGGGGKILFVGQGFGTNAAGEAVTLDVSRFDEDSQFTGDDIIVDVGDPGSGVSLQAVEELGTVQLDGRTMSADDLTFSNFDDFSEQTGSFVLNC